MGQPLDAPMTMQLLALRTELIKEEVTEFIAEAANCMMDILRDKQVTRENRAKLLKELVDVQYVISGFAETFGLPLETAFNRVHASNMSKLDDYGRPIRREDGKVLKGPNYVEPLLLDLV
jgi:predicted HAD superfamily Cof-like phosphohydrolase